MPSARSSRAPAAWASPTPAASTPRPCSPSPSVAGRERRLARPVAEVIGVEVVEVHTHEGENPDYQKNDGSRCFHCKDELFTRIGDDVVGAQRLGAVAYGENADDATRHDRP